MSVYAIVYVYAYVPASVSVCACGCLCMYVPDSLPGRIKLALVRGQGRARGWVRTCVRARAHVHRCSHCPFPANLPRNWVLGFGDRLAATQSPLHACAVPELGPEGLRAAQC